MSRPIYEPSLPRADAELGYGNRQLFRRPAPAAAEATGWPAYPYIYREMSTDTPKEIDSDTAGESIIFDNDEVAHSDMQGYFSAYSANQTIIEGQGAGTRGVYEFTGGIHWQDEFDDGFIIRLSSGGFGWAPAVYGKEPFGGNNNLPNNGDLAFFFNFRARLFTTSDHNLFMTVAHESASNQTVESAFFEIAYLGPFEGGNASYIPFGFWN